MANKRTRGMSHDLEKERNKKKNYGSCYLPDGLDREILLRLPVRSLLRFRCLNKKVRDLITTQQFFKDHLLKTSQRDGDLLLLNQTWCPNHRYRLYNNNGRFSVRLDRPTYLQDLAPPHGKTDYKTVRTIGYCNGVVCLMGMYENFKYKVILWNPSIKKSMIISTPFFFEDFRYGFGCVNDDFKLVAVPYFYGIGFPLETTVCSSKTGNWASVTCSWADPSLQHQQVTGEIGRWRLSTFVNGACHWFAKEYRDGGAADVLLSFNLGEETYHKIDMPSNCSEWDSMHVCGESLALIETMNRKRQFVVWVMKKYGVVDSWTKIIESVNLDKGIGYVLGFKGRGDVVYSRRWRKKLVPHYNELVCYDPMSTRTRYWKAKHVSRPDARLHAYRENFVFLNEDVQ